LRHSDVYLALGGNETGIFITVAISTPSFFASTTLVMAAAEEVLLLLFESLLNEVAQAQLSEGGEEVCLGIHPTARKRLAYLLADHF
jgi:hypothetical protein